jgi:hypothetical protein
MSNLFSFCIKHLPKCYFNRLSLRPIRVISNWAIPNCSFFREHLSHTLPNENNFHRLRSTHSDSLMRHNSAELKLDTLEIIIKWLQVSVSECNHRNPQTKIVICNY